MNLETNFFGWFSERLKARLHLLLLGLFFLGGLHYSERHVGGVGIELPYNQISWIVLACLIGVGLFRIARSRSIIFSRLTAMLAFCALLLTLPTFYPDSSLVNESPIHLGLLGGLMVVVSIQQFRPELRDVYHILFMVLCGALIESMIAWSNYLGISFKEFTLEGIGAGIPYGTIRQRNVLSTLFVTALCVGAYLLCHSYQNQVSKRLGILIKGLVLASPLFLLPLIILLKSRTGWVGCVVSLALILPILGLLRKKLALAWIASVVIGLSVVPVLELFSENAEVVSSDKLNLAGPRNYMYEQILDMALEKPIAGYGFGNFESAYNLHGAEGYAQGRYETASYENLSNPHNEILYWWVEGGILGLAGILLAAYFVLKRILTLDDKRERVLLLALFFPIVFHTQTEIPFLISVGHWIIFLMIILLVDVQSEAYREKRVEYFLLPAILSVAVPVIVGLFMLTTLLSGRLLNRAEYDMDLEVSTLENISNPVVWQDRLMWDMNFGLLALAYYQNRPELARNYIEWAPEIIKRKPRAGYYHYLVIAHQLVGNEEEAEKVKAEALFRFPQREFDFNASVLRGIERKDIDAIKAPIIDD